MTIKCDYQHPETKILARRTVVTRRVKAGYEQLHWDDGQCTVCRRHYASLVTTSRSRTPPPSERAWPARNRSTP